MSVSLKLLVATLGAPKVIFGAMLRLKCIGLSNCGLTAHVGSSYSRP